MSNMVPNKPPSTSVGLDLYIDSTFLVSSSEHSYHNYNKMVIKNYSTFYKITSFFKVYSKSVEDFEDLLQFSLKGRVLL